MFPQDGDVSIKIPVLCTNLGLFCWPWSGSFMLGLGSCILGLGSFILIPTFFLGIGLYISIGIVYRRYTGSCWSPQRSKQPVELRCHGNLQLINHDLLRGCTFAFK